MSQEMRSAKRAIFVRAEAAPCSLRIPLRESRRGFTLIELLVVIAIIAILAAILFPVFAQARERGRLATCTSNLHQIYIALTQYADDFRGFMPPAPKSWPGTTDFKKQYDGLGPLYPYAKTGKVFWCVKASKVNDPGTGYVLVQTPGTNPPQFFQASYHFWPHIYGPNDYLSPGRLDVDLDDPGIVLNNQFSAQSRQTAKEMGGPVVSDFLHAMSMKGDQGVLSLMIKGGNVKFSPAATYPWTY